MLEILLCILLLAILAATAYCAAYQWINLRHSRDTIADELKRAMEHIAELEERILQLEAERSLRDYKPEPTRDTSGWDAFEVRG